LPASNDAPEPSELGPALLTLLQPPEDLHERIRTRLAERLQRRQDMELFGSMLGVARETSEILLNSPPPTDAGLVADDESE